ncbi:MAG: CBS domain-containing protein [Deltaproteobacteria bacterium]|nr:CBS domain-containing protein [Deltaproteobacteria bacterium]
MKNCGQIMTSNPVCCVGNDTIEYVAQCMRNYDVGPILIVENNLTKKLIGIVTDRDIALKMAEGLNPKTTPVSQVMTRNIVSCQEEDTIADALQVMADHRIRRIPVLDNANHLVGIISQSDLFGLFQRPPGS